MTAMICSISAWLTPFGRLHKSGDLAARVARVGVKMAPRLKKPKHHVFEERSEMERIRAPHAPAA